MRSFTPDSETPMPRPDAHADARRGGGLRRRALRMAPLILVAACGTAPGKFTAWSPMEYRPTVAPSDVEVYAVRYDSVADRLSAPPEMSAYDTIGIVVQEPKVLENFDDKSELFRYNPKVVKKLKKQAWELGGDAVLLGTPKIGRRGLDHMIRDFLAHESAEGDTAGIGSIRKMEKNPWVTHIAFVLRSRGAKAADRSDGNRR